MSKKKRFFLLLFALVFSLTATGRALMRQDRSPGKECLVQVRAYGVDAAVAKAVTQESSAAFASDHKLGGCPCRLVSFVSLPTRLEGGISSSLYQDMIFILSLSVTEREGNLFSSSRYIAVGLKLPYESRHFCAEVGIEALDFPDHSPIF